LRSHTQSGDRREFVGCSAQAVVRPIKIASQWTAPANFVSGGDLTISSNSFLTVPKDPIATTSGKSSSNKSPTGSISRAFRALGQWTMFYVQATAEEIESIEGNKSMHPSDDGLEVSQKKSAVVFMGFLGEFCLLFGLNG
jgi:hypothetical protein